MLKAKAWYDEAKKTLAQCKEEMNYDSDDATYVMMKDKALQTFRNMLDKELALGPEHVVQEVTYDKKEGKKKKERVERVGNAPFIKYGNPFKAAGFADVLKNHKAKLPKKVEWVPDRPGNVPKGKCQARRYKDPEGELLIRVVEEAPAQKYQVWWCNADWKIEALEKKRAKMEEKDSTTDEEAEAEKNGGDGGTSKGQDQVQVEAPVDAAAQAPTPAPAPPQVLRASRRRNPIDPAGGVAAAAPGAAASSDAGRRRR